jgi:beta-glucanase (GH16 family)
MINRNICSTVIGSAAAVVVLMAAALPARAGTWGATQTLSPSNLGMWNIVNGRWTDNDELETYTSSCVFAEGSTLILKAYQSGSTYYSGRVESHATYGFGNYSFTASLPSGQGILGAVWTAALNPWLPEIDAAEIVGQNPGTSYQTFHWAAGVSGQVQFSNTIGQANAFHTYSFSFYPNDIDFFVDGHYITSTYCNYPTASMHFIADVAVGGDWPGNPNSSTWATADGARYLKLSNLTFTPYTP